MPNAAAALAPQPPTPQGVRFVARQPILDRQRRLFGYELLFRDSWVNSFGATDADLARRGDAYVVSLLLFAIGAISIIGGRAFNDAKTKPSQAASSAPASLSSPQLVGSQKRFGAVSHFAIEGLA